MHSTTDRGHELPDLILPEAVRAHLSALQSQLAERDATLVERDAELKRRELKIAQLTLELAHHKGIRFGCKSEALSPEQRDLFIEASDEDGAAIVAELEQQQKPANAPRQYKRTGRNPFPPELPRIEHRHEPESCTCGDCGRDLVKIGEDISEQLDVEPARFFVHRHIRPQYACRSCETITAAPVPAAIIDGGLAAPGLHAWVFIQKYLDHLPLYRIEKISDRHGVSIARSTLCGWLADAAHALTPLWRLLRDHVLASNIVNTDDTPVPVQDPDRDHCRTGRIWAYVSRHGTVYDATEDRSRAGPLEFLRGFQGFLQCDAYAGYDELFRRSQGTIIEVGCWAHARRKFVEAQKTSPREAHEAVVRIKQLYAVEHEAKACDVTERRSLRQQKSVPLLAALNPWLDQLAVTALPKSPLGEAVTYARNQWAALNVYVTDGALAMDNNLAERAVKPYAIGRKNWLFFGSDDGGRRLAILSSFTATCQQFGVNPWTWLQQTLTKLPLTPADQLATLLPTSDK